MIARYRVPERETAGRSPAITVLDNQADHQCRDRWQQYQHVITEVRRIRETHETAQTRSDDNDDNRRQHTASVVTSMLPFLCHVISPMTARAAHPSRRRNGDRFR